MPSIAGLAGRAPVVINIAFAVIVRSPALIVCSSTNRAAPRTTSIPCLRNSSGLSNW